MIEFDGKKKGNGGPLSSLSMIINFLKGDGLKSKLLRDGIGSLIFKSSYVLLSFFMGVVLARSLGAKDYGIYGYVSAIISTLIIPAEFGLPTLILRETASNVARERWDLAKGAWRWAMKIIIIMTVVLVIGSLIATLFLNKKFSPDELKTFFWGLLLVPFLSFSQLRGAQLRGLKKVLLANLPEQILIPSLIIILILTTVNVFSVKLTPEMAMIINVIAAISAFIIGAILLIRFTPTEIRLAQPREEGKKWIKSAIPLAGINGLSMLNKQVSILILGLFVSADQIGVYKIAIQFSILASIGLQVVNMVVAPQFASMYAKNEMKRLQRLVTASSRAVILVNLFITVVIIILGKPFLKLAYGEAFVLAYEPMMILLIGQFINSVTGSVGYLLNMTGKENYTIACVGIGTLANLILNLLLSPKFGSNGAAIGTATSLIISNIIMWLVVKKQLGINTLAFNPVVFFKRE